MNKLDIFEESLKNSMEGFEVPYNSADWDKLSDRMDKEQGGNGSSATLYAGLLAGALLIGGAAFYMLSDDAQNTDIAENTTVVSEQPTDPRASEENASFLAEQQEDESSTSAEPAGNDEKPDSENSTDNEEPGNSLNQGSAVTNTGMVSPTSASDVSPEQGSMVGKPTADTEKRNTAQNDAPKSITPPEEKSRIVAISTHAGTVDGMVAGGAFSMKQSGSCEGSKVSFKLDAVDAGTHYLWNFGDGSFSNLPEPEHVYERPGKYQVTLVRTGGQGGKKIQSQPTEEIIEIHAAPEADFRFGDREEKGKIPYMHFENVSTSAVECIWDFGDGSTSRKFHPNHVYRKAGTYQVKLQVKNGNGCTDEKTTSVVVELNNPLGAPLTFSPNGDGVKDDFLPESLKTLNAPFKLTIYDQEGAPVFTSYSSDKAWNGTLQDGSNGEAGVYVWMVNFLEGEYADMMFQGRTNLIR